MDKRLKLQAILEDLLGLQHVYYQPNESLKMEYPAIKYSVSNIESKFANNKKYSNITCYEVVVIDKMPDNEVIQKILELPLSYFDRHYVSDNLNHDSIILYY